MESQFDSSLLQPARFTRELYDRMIDAGLLEGQKVELLYGVIVDKSPQEDDHFLVVLNLTNLLAQRVAGRALVSSQGPLSVSKDSEPEPDLVLLPMGARWQGKQSRAHLVIEVSMSSLQRDRKLKARLYAETGQPEYWVVDIANRVVIVHRDPREGTYATVSQHKEGEELPVLELPGITVAVDDCLPPKG